MNAVLTIAAKEFRDGLRNRWVVAATLLLAGLALALAFLGSAPTGAVGASPLAVTVVSLASLSIFLIPLIALMLAFDALVGEIERGTMMLLLSYPVARWQVLVGKFLGHGALLALAILLGYGLAGAVIRGAGGHTGDWFAYAAMVGTSILLGAVFLALGYLASAVVHERATAAGLAVGLWLLFVLLFDLVLLGALVATGGEGLSAGMVGGLLLLNPTDAYRLFNLAGLAEVRQFSGLAGIADQIALSPGAAIGALLAWIAVPLALAGILFSRRSI